MRERKGHQSPNEEPGRDPADPADRAGSGGPRLKESLSEELRVIDEARGRMAGLIDHLPIEDAEILGVAFCAITDARTEIREAIAEVLGDGAGDGAGDDGSPEVRPGLAAPGAALDSEPGLMSASELRDLVGRLANSRHVRYWLGHNHGPSGLYPPEGEHSLMAFELLDVTEDGPGGTLRAEPAEIDERDIREMGFAKEVRGGAVYWVVRRAGQDGTPWRPRLREVR